MIIDLRTITQEPRRFDFVLEPDWWVSEGENEPVLGLDGPLQVQLSVYRAGRRFVLDGRLSGTLLLTCDRCLKAFRHQLDSKFRLFLSFPPEDVDQGEMELVEEDMSLDFITGYEISAEDIVREQIFLSLPMKFLCREECAGLCPVCGSDLNGRECGCLRKEGHPGFAKLKSLNVKGSED